MRNANDTLAARRITRGTKKQQLIEQVLNYNDEAPREILRSMSISELKKYLEDLRQDATRSSRRW